MPNRVTLAGRGRAVACADIGGVTGAAVVGLVAPFIMPDGGGGAMQGWVWFYNWPDVWY